MRNTDKDNAVGNLTDYPQTPPDVYHDGQPKVNYWRKAVNWVNQEDDDKWLENMRGMLSVISTMIATITFQFAINPPGGVVQASVDDTLEKLQSCRNDGSRPCAGDAVSALIYEDDYHQFQKYNTICFIASLSVSLLLLSGIPLNRRFPVWNLSLGIIIILSFLALTFLSGMLLATPTFESSWEPFRRIYKRTFITWTVLVGMVGLFLTIRFLVWFITKRVEVFKHCKWMAPGNEHGDFSQWHGLCEACLPFCMYDIHVKIVGFHVEGLD